ncbi:MAG: hypothetical protein ACI3ZL_02680 [Candidatus Cryptobacteroides sp.]
MAKRILTTFLSVILASGFCSATQKPRRDYPVVTYGVEWGYVASVLSSVHYNFYSLEGSRVDIKESESIFRSDAEMEIHVGVNLGKMWNLSLYSGYTNIAHLTPAVPISLRLTRFYGKNPLNDRWMTYVGLGGGIALNQTEQAILGARIGGGYRVSLSRITKLDILVSCKMDYLNPDIVYYGHAIPPESINRNNAFMTAFTIGLGITF